MKLAYSSADNFLGRDMYGDLERCYLQKDAVDKLAAAGRMLAKMRPDLHLLARDCSRPVRVQEMLWKAARKVIKGKALRAYVAHPHKGIGSMHSYGCAMDLTLAGGDGEALDMGTPYDSMTPLAQPRHELKHLSAGKLSPAQVSNRLLLRLVMVGAGFRPLASEWWHFNCASPREVLRRYRKIP